jgi:hypothetical protein
MEGNSDYLLAEEGQLQGLNILPSGRSQAATSCFGEEQWPADHPIPQGWIEYEVQDLASATRILREKGYRLLVANRTEPWGQTVTRLLSPEVC